jgi:hypothetical protein
MEPYRKEATWANDWLLGGITLIKDGHKLSFLMNHLLIEELEEFKSWLIKINEGTPIPSSFDFVDADLFFELIEVKEDLILRLAHGYEGDNQIFIDTSLRQHAELISLQIEGVKSLLELFPCRCGLEHNLFSRQF